MHFTPWSTPVNAEAVASTSTELNTPFNDGCPIQSPDGLSLYMASNRPGGLGGQDIWVARRTSRDARWGVPGRSTTSASRSPFLLRSSSLPTRARTGIT
jgi:Tol biopolymer transport system component